MLKKLLKYDLKFVFKYWWIAATVCLSLSAIGGIFIRLLSSDRELPAIVETSAIFMLLIAVISFVAFMLLSFILTFIRFYSNFFSDEGYLTFTLPVKVSSLINSKVITAMLLNLCTQIMIGICVCVMLIVGFWREFLLTDFIRLFSEIIELCFNQNVLCRIIYIIEILLLSVLSSVFSTLFLFICITFSSIITKKARVITSIGIYYGVNCVLSLVLQIFSFFGITSIARYFENLPLDTLEPIICLAGFGIILLVLMFCAILYSLQYRMLDRKLNLV